jgi:TolB-like protein/Flp pilus assembly protein TadD
VVAVLALTWTLATSVIDRQPGPVEPPAPRVLMVLPFVNLSDDPAQQYLTDGVGDILTADLAGIGALRVISWHTSLRYRQTTKRLAEVGQEVKADAIIEGSVQRTGDRFRVTARLIHTASDTLLWASTYERDTGDLFAMQGEIATAIAHAVRLTLTGPEQARLANRYVTRPRAQDAYLQGRRLFYTFNVEGVRNACALFEKAVTEDPRYALAYASLARCYLALQDFGLMSPAEARQRSTRAAAAALATDDALPEAHNALAEVRFKFDWDWAGAERSYLAALALNPGSSLVRSPYSRFLSALGRTDEALQQAQLAAESEPLAAEMRTSIAVILYYQRRYGEAISEYLKALELNSLFPPAHLGLGRAYAAIGKFPEAVEELNLALDQSGGDLSYVAVLAAAHAQAGARAEAEKLLERLLTEAARPSPRIAPQDLAYVYAALGNRDEAFAWLDKAFEHRSSRILWLKVDPRVDSLRSDPRFAALIRRLGLPL